MKYNDFYTQLQNKRKIIFYSSGIEIGWELARWCGWIRWYKKNHINSIIRVATRKSRRDFYYGFIDNIYTYNINGDYSKYRPNMYRLDFWPQEEYDKLIDEIKTKFRDFYICSPPMYTTDRNFFPQDKMDFNFTPHPENLKIIKDILSKHKEKIPICISPRHRIDSPKPTRNWPEQYWQDLFARIKQNGKYIVFVMGEISSMIISPKDKTFIVLDKIRTSNTSNIGLTIEAIKNSVLTVGQQSALPILSNYLKIKTIMWGNEKVRHQIKENPMNTRCVFFEESSVYYNTSPRLIFETILKETSC